ncbi:MAG TPA: cytochrome oxidase small assembly protein [Burkholderiales bacterium]|nr:cytochrome oxidase small assembly protein [Burkholderiales bacterium]
MTDRRKQNQRLGWILASVVAALFVGFVAKAALLGI